MYTIFTGKIKLGVVQCALTSSFFLQLGSYARAERMRKDFSFNLYLSANVQCRHTPKTQSHFPGCSKNPKSSRFCFKFQFNFTHSIFNKIDSFKNAILNGKQTCTAYLFVTPLAILNCQILLIFISFFSYFLIFMINNHD